MKKYIAVLFTFALIFSFNTNTAGAIAGAYSDIPGCSFPNQPYSVTTGQACGSSSFAECAYGDLFSAVTGKSCNTDEQKPKPVCMYTVNSELKIGSRGEEVKKLQQNLRDAGLLSGKADGVYGKMTESARQNYFKKCPIKNSGSVKVLSPNGGENWYTGTTKTIKWEDNTPIPECPTGALCNAMVSKHYDIKLVQYNDCSTSKGSGLNCAAWYSQERIVAESVSGSSYKWVIPNCHEGSECSSNFEIPAGSYKIQVCQTGTDKCDYSDNLFKIYKNSLAAPTS